MPAKAMTYKFLNTFIDDLFAFTIKMPTLHRLATLRDDVIFFIYLYQSYAYKVNRDISCKTFHFMSSTGFMIAQRSMHK